MGRANGTVAQLVERCLEESGVNGSIPFSTTTSFHREVPDEVAAELRRWVRNIPKYGPRDVEESGLSRTVWVREHAGSNPAIPTNCPVVYVLARTQVFGT